MRRRAVEDADGRHKSGDARMSEWRTCLLTICLYKESRRGEPAKCRIDGSAIAPFPVDCTQECVLPQIGPCDRQMCGGEISLSVLPALLLLQSADNSIHWRAV